MCTVSSSLGVCISLARSLCVLARRISEEAASKSKNSLPSLLCSVILESFMQSEIEWCLAGNGAVSSGSGFICTRSKVDVEKSKDVRKVRNGEMLGIS